MSISALIYACALLLLARHCDFYRMFFKRQKHIIKITWHKVGDELDDLVSVLYYVKFMAWLLRNSWFILPLLCPPLPTTSQNKQTNKPTNHWTNNINPSTKEKRRRKKNTWWRRPWTWELWKPLPAHICCNLWGMRICGNLHRFRPTTNKCLRGNEKNGSFKRIVLSLSVCTAFLKIFCLNLGSLVLCALNQCFHINKIPYN